MANDMTLFFLGFSSHIAPTPRPAKEKKQKKIRALVWSKEIIGKGGVRRAVFANQWLNWKGSDSAIIDIEKPSIRRPVRYAERHSFLLKVSHSKHQQAPSLPAPPLLVFRWWVRVKTGQSIAWRYLQLSHNGKSRSGKENWKSPSVTLVSLFLCFCGEFFTS